MATLQQQILDKFAERLAKSEALELQRIEKLRALLGGEKKPKIEELVKIFTEPSGEDLK